jgi:crotonobetainyl-CoA:carnitine CoA-transferase CaiB-like acyl-CoA transferase
MWHLNNRNKRGITLDFSKPEGREILDELIDARIALELLVHAGVVHPGHGRVAARRPHPIPAPIQQRQQDEDDHGSTQAAG